MNGLSSFSVLLIIALLSNEQRCFVDAFGVKTTPTPPTFDLQSTAFEESEWYTPPPPRKEVSQPKNGQRILRSHIQTNKELDEYLKADDRLTIVNFHARWCKTCKKTNVRLDKLALQHGDWVNQDGAVVRGGSMRFASVEIDAGREVCQTLNIQKIPTVHIYSRATKVQDFVCVSTTDFQRLYDFVQYYLAEQKRAQRKRTVDFEATLDCGREMIERTLVEETNVTAESSPSL